MSSSWVGTSADGISSRTESTDISTANGLVGISQRHHFCQREENGKCFSPFWTDLDVQLLSHPFELCFLYPDSVPSQTPWENLGSDFGMWACSRIFSLALLSVLAVVDESMGRAHKRARNIQGNVSELTSGPEQPGHSSSAKGLPGTGCSISLFPALNLVRMFYRQFSIEMSAMLSTRPLPCT